MAVLVMHILGTSSHLGDRVEELAGVEGATQQFQSGDE
jgi:hypothetical protein